MTDTKTQEQENNKTTEQETVDVTKETEEAAATSAENDEVTAKDEVITKDEIVERIPDLKPGMTVRVYQKIKETNTKGEEKERVQYYEGIIIAKKHGKEAGASINVRKISDGIGVEKIFPLNLPAIEKIVIKKTAKVKRAKLYFLRHGYKKNLKEKVVAK